MVCAYSARLSVPVSVNGESSLTVATVAPYSWHVSLNFATGVPSALMRSALRLIMLLLLIRRRCFSVGERRITSAQSAYHNEPHRGGKTNFGVAIELQCLTQFALFSRVWLYAVQCFSRRDRGKHATKNNQPGFTAVRRTTPFDRGGPWSVAS